MCENIMKPLRVEMLFANVYGIYDGTTRIVELKFPAMRGVEANKKMARLFASAPDMLEACKKGVEKLEEIQRIDINSGCCDNAEGAGPCETCDVIAFMRKVIARAKGETDETK